MTWLVVLVGVAAVTARLQPPRPRASERVDASASAPSAGGRWRRSLRARRAVRPDWPRFLDRVAADVRGGTSLRHAVTRAAEALGVPAHLLVPGSGEGPDPDRGVVVQALDTAGRLGGAVAVTMQQAANLLREREAVRAEAAVHSAQARLSARVLTAVPLVFSAWSATADRTFRRALLSPVGTVAAAAGLTCNVAGWLWMRRLVRQAIT